MNSTQYDEQFQAIGSLISYSSDRDTDITSAQTDLETLSSKLTNEYDAISGAFNFAITMVNTRITNLGTQKTLAKNVIQNYLLNVTKNDLSSGGTSVNLVLDDLISDMETQNETVLISGTFWNYFNDNFGKELNSTTSSETILDSWAE